MMILFLNNDVNFYKRIRNTKILIFYNDIRIKDLVKIIDFQNLKWFISNFLKFLKFIRNGEMSLVKILINKKLNEII